MVELSDFVTLYIVTVQIVMALYRTAGQLGGMGDEIRCVIPCAAANVNNELYLPVLC